MFKQLILGSTLALAFAVPTAHASDLTKGAAVVRAQPSLPDEVIEVHHSRPSTAGTIAADTIGGGIAGTAIGGGVALYNRYVSSDKNWGNWQRDLAIGAGVGLAVGLVFGIVDASSAPMSNRVYAPATDHRDLGYSAPLGTWAGRF